MLLLASLAAPFGAVAYGAASLVAPLGRSAANALLGLVAPLSGVEPAPAPDALTEEEPVAVSPGALPVSGNLAAPRRGQARAAPRAKPESLFVSQAQVLALSQRAALPRGAFVPQTPEHPAGLRLAGVGALGIGVQDGDILVEALGIAPRAPGELIGAILQARAKNTRFLSGTLWRRGNTFRITVEQPYLPARG